MITDTQWLSLFLAGVLGGFAVGYLWGRRPLLFWRIQCIRLEHDLAAAQGRLPRHIDQIEKEAPKEDGRG